MITTLFFDDDDDDSDFPLGFICPVHTPDGAPCGLLNHLSKNCIVLNEMLENPQVLFQALTMLGMTPLHSTPPVPHAQCLEVVLDGGLVGLIRKSEAQKFANKLRIMKTRGEVRRNFCAQSRSIMYLFITKPETNTYLEFLHHDQPTLRGISLKEQETSLYFSLIFQLC